MMNTYIKPFVCILFVVLLLTGCVPVQKTVELKTTPVPTVVESTEQPAPSPTDTVKESPTHTPAPTASQKPFDPRKIEHNLTETRKHILHRKPYQTEDGEEYVTEIDVLEDGEVLQTLTIKDAIEKALKGLPRETEIERIQGGYYRNWDRTYWFFMRHDDINFDGYNDFAIMLDGGGTAETWLYWIWDEDSDGYQPCCILTGQHVGLDAENKTIVTRTHEGSGTYYNYVYAWLDEERPSCVQLLIEDRVDIMHIEQRYDIYFEPVDGEMVEIRRVVGEEEHDELYLTFVYEYEMEVTSDLSIMLRTYGQARGIDSSFGYMIAQIDVMNPERVLYQSIDFSGITKYSGADIAVMDGNIDVTDYNHDGYNDFSLEIEKEHPETGYLRHWWLWNPQTNQFDYAGIAE